ncbi:M1 family metallopeptidase [Sanyastnella coralliicola]|uniref:M1 family metallopeptidase n=1 Tax=Sanyastnella coralliicola TaxID=3069118 RepID=UPI0027B8CB31|nr:M1 family metallopeptidase [Longitalea sp. SCSIO 12813]
MIRIILPLSLCFLLAACGVIRETTAPEPIEIVLDEIEITPEKPRELRPTEKKVHDLLHTRLDVSFDWQNRYLNGVAELTLKPWFYPSDRLILDAKGMDINSVVLLDSVETPLTFEYDGLFLDISLARKYSRFEEYTLRIDYVAKPDEFEAQGSAAITDAKGLYFINPDSSEVDKPTQVWTQGQTESSSVWFPTIDTPAERMTQEIFMTVRKEFQTLSNGTLIYSNFNADNTRTDYWKMDLAHPPYLAMMAAGDFIIAHDSWEKANGAEIPVNYYVERDYANYAYNIFGNTPEMLTFYSDVLDYEYPWDKYSQIIVRDYVSGAMENTTSVIHGEFLNQTDRELLDYDYEDVIAHELFHHWFGDLVTCESWSHLPLNESFATYGEYLWAEYKNGVDEADFRGWQSERGYINEARTKRVPLIRFEYDDKEDMFDAHSYNKGGRILHMLRRTVGDSAFFKSLNVYLKENAFKDAEADKLRHAFEDVTGLDLNWFFDQWFYQAGHPELTYSYFYDDSLKQMQVVVEQTQNLDNNPLYSFPVQLDIYYGDDVVRHEIMVSQEEEVFRFDVSEEPSWIDVDANRALLCERDDRKPEDWWAKQFMKGGDFRHRLEVLEHIDKDPKQEHAMILEAALSDPHWYIRSKSMSLLSELDTISDMALKEIQLIAQNDPKTSTRSRAIRFLAEDAPELITEADLIAGIEKERSYFINAASLEALASVNMEKAVGYANDMAGSESSDVLEAIAEVYIASGEPSHQSFFELQIREKSPFMKYGLLQQYAAYLQTQNAETCRSALSLVEEVSADPGVWWVNVSNYRLLNAVIVHLESMSVEGVDNPVLEDARELHARLLENEENPSLQGVLSELE